MIRLLSSATMIVLLHTACFGQYNASQLCNEDIKLNGGIRSQMGGISRSGLPLILPENTTGIAISITISTTDNHIDEFALTSSLVSVFATGNILSVSDAVNSMAGSPGTGTGILDYWIFNNRDCAQAFVSKTGTCNAYYGRQNSGGGVFYIPYSAPAGTVVYLCFRNPSEYNAVYFHVEATAVTEVTETGNTDYGGQPNYMKIKYK